MVVDRGDVGEQVEWNMAGLLNMELARLRNEANQYYTKHEYSKAFSCLLAMKQSAIHTIRPEERTELEKIEDKFYNIVGLLNTSLKIENQKLYFKVVGMVSKLYNSYNNKLQDYLDFYGFLGDRKKDSSKLAGF